MAECATHAIFAAEVGAYTESEAVLPRRLLAHLSPGMVLLADRGFSPTHCGKRPTTRVRTCCDGFDQTGWAPKPRLVEDLGDGSYLAHLQQTHSAAARAREPILVRVVDYQIDDGRANPEQYRLFTTMMDPAEVVATDLGPGPVISSV